MKNNHYSEDELVLFFYDEGASRRTMQAHLDACDACSTAYRDIASTLQMVAAPVAPERGDHYGLEVWQRLRPALPVRPPSHATAWWSLNRLMACGAVAAAIVAAFVVGSLQHAPSTGATTAGDVTAVSQAVDSTELARIAAISDHLEESERLLVDFVNASGQTINVAGQKALAADLVETNRLYREAADGAGDVAVAELLDELERSLIEIAHGPSTITPAAFNKTRMRLDAAGLLFKVRVLSDELRERESVTTTPIRKDA